MNAEIKKVDSEGKIELPKKWRESELNDNNEVIIFEEQGILKIIPRRNTDLKKFFDTLEIDDDLIDKLEDWNEFENHQLKLDPL